MKKEVKNSKNSKESKELVEQSIGEFGWCRGVTHFWAPVGAILRIKNFVQASVQCEHCGTVRSTKLDLRGRIIGQHHTYKYPSGYIVPGTKIARSKVRVELFVNRAVAAPVEEETENQSS